MAQAWEPLLDRLLTDRYPALIARTRLLGVADADADDLVQTALIATFSKARGFDNTAKAEAYVKQAIVTAYLDELRKRKLESQRWAMATLANPDGGLIKDHAPERGLHVDVERALDGLSPRERACVTLRYLDDLTVPAVAAALHLSEGSVKRYVHDGLAKLNAALGTDASADDADLVVINVRKGDRS